MLISVWVKTIIHVIFNANISVGSCYLAIVHRLVLYLLDQTFTRKNSDNAISIIHTNEEGKLKILLTRFKLPNYGTHTVKSVLQLALISLEKDIFERH